MDIFFHFARDFDSMNITAIKKNTEMFKYFDYIMFMHVRVQTYVRPSIDSLAHTFPTRK